jgi:CheY-like chemotaxis protein/anti-sigma regulatory factor (Ser/Thr protein kinase)
VTGDERKLRQVLLNLLGNAVKFSGKGSITVRAVWRDAVGSFEVADHGPGIAPEERARLFTPFAQTETGIRSKEGTGLGLAISRSFVRLMGGDLTVESEVGRGSVFRFTASLPASADDAAAAPARKRVVGLAAGSDTKRVLAVDDVAESRLLLSKLLSSIGLDVREAANGEEAVAGWREFRPHLVLMDMRMPVVDGQEATRRIRDEEARGGGPRTPIVAVSATVLEQDRDDVLASGCDDYLAKPFREADLFDVLSRHLALRFVTEDAAPEASLTPARLASLPAEVRAALTDALVVGDDEAAVRVLARLGDRHAALATELSQAIAACRFSELLGVLERAASSV